MRVDFYLLESASAEQATAQLARATLNAGELLLVVGAGEAMDRALWEEFPQDFLAHGRADHPHAERQPILLAPDCAAANGARFVLIADGLWREEALGFARAFLLFDDNSRAGARDTWRRLGEQEGVERNFWRQEAGRWIKQA
tara:strand:- start:26893 stop:27318 length:426 start_codon:yes stop_codon:yes gene_type:complete